MSNEQVKRILYCQPETAGDILISTGVISSIAAKFPNAKIYFATKKEFFSILKDNPHITALLEYDETMLNYRSLEKWGMHNNPFDIVYCPFIVTQKIPHWIHSGNGEFLGTVYADMCNVDFGEQFIAIDNNLDSFGLPSEFITVQSQTRQDPKDYDYMQNVIDRIMNIDIVQIGGASDKKLSGKIIDLRGKTTPQQLAGILFRSKLHIGLDSFPMHIASHVGCPVVAMFGGTYAKQGSNPLRAGLIHAIETQDRGPCVTSCHLSECEAKRFGFNKCINNISPLTVLEKVGSMIGTTNIKPMPPIKLSTYTILKNGIKYGFPFAKCIEYAAKIADEVVVVDGGSDDGTLEALNELAQNPSNKLVVKQHVWNMGCPTLMGDEKTWAKKQCSHEYTLQLDADEIIVEPYVGSTKDLIAKLYYADVIDLPCFNFYGDANTIRIEDQIWKWRISKSSDNVIHGVHGKARQLDPDTMQVTYDKSVSDSCEMIYENSLEIAKHRPGFHTSILMTHEALKAGVIKPEQYIKMLQEALQYGPIVFHYSWINLERKLQNGDFWNETWHGQRNATHNTTKDISERIAAKKDMLLSVNIDHPLKDK